MATTSTKDKTDETTQAPQAFPVVLGEFCAGLSSADQRVEMIGAFHAEEQSAGRVKDLESNYRKRFDEFCRRPVKD